MISFYLVDAKVGRCRNVIVHILIFWRKGAVIGPFFYDGALNGDTYNNMLQDNMITSIRRAYGVRFRNCWFMHDGAPAHRCLTVRDTLRVGFGILVMHRSWIWHRVASQKSWSDTMRFLSLGSCEKSSVQDSSSLSRDTPRENNSTIQFIEEQPSSNPKGRPLHGNSCGKMPCS